jgi:hypothetical protein
VAGPFAAAAAPEAAPEALASGNTSKARLIATEDGVAVTDDGGVEAAAESEGLALLKCGLAWAVRRTVVKRPKNAPPLGGQKPSHSVVGSVSRFDVYLAPASM